MNIIFWVTSDCNLNCIYCYEGSNKERINMSKNTVDASIKFIFRDFIQSDEKNLVVSIHGGEPFLAFDTIRYIVNTVKKEAKDKEINVLFTTTTNATILTEEMIEFIFSEIPAVSVSIDGDKYTHDKTRPYKNGDGTHDIVIKNTKKLLKKIPRLRVRLTYSSNTVDKLYANIKYLIDMGIKCIVPVNDFYDKDWNRDKLNVLESQLRMTKKYIKSMDDIAISMLDKSVYKYNGICGGGITSINITPNGNLYPCTITVGSEKFCIGNIYEGINLKGRSNLLDYSNIKNIDCIGCNLYDFCKETRCKMLNKIQNGEYCKSSPVACAIENIKYKVNFN